MDGTFVSHTMQQGDCNAPATFQRLMTIIFRDFIWKFIHIYLDNIFILSDSMKDHEKHLRLVFDELCKCNYILRRTNLISTKNECIVLVILSITDVYMQT